MAEDESTHKCASLCSLCSELKNHSYFQVYKKLTEREIILHKFKGPKSLSVRQCSSTDMALKAWLTVY